MALLMMLCGTTWGQVFIDTYTHEFTGKQAVGSCTLSEVGWTIAATTTGDTFTGWDANKGAQFGKSADPCTTLSFSTEGIPGNVDASLSCTINQIVVNTSGASGIDAKLTVSVGGKAYTCGESDSYTLTTTPTEATFSGSSKGKIELKWTNTAKAIYVKSIAVTYTLQGSGGPSVEPQVVDLFTADVTATEVVSFAKGTTEITSSWADIEGGKMSAISEQADAKNLIGKQGKDPLYYMFCMTNNNTYFKVDLNFALAVGDVISANTYSRDDTPLGLFISTASTRPGSCDTKLSIDAVKTVAYEPLSSYTVKEGDGLVGAKTFYIYRETGKSTYFDDFKIIGLEREMDEPAVVVTPAVPTFSLAAGEYTEPQTVELSCTTDGAAIMYTLDGTDPRNKKGMEYLEPITITETTTIKALAVLNGVESEVAEATYTITAAQEPEEPAGDYQWVLTAPEDLATGDVIAIVDQQEGKAMSNDNGTSMAPAAVAVTLSDDLSEITSDVAKNLQWQVTVAKDGLQFGADAENFLYAIDSNNGLRVGSNENNVFSVYTSTADDKSGEGITYLTIPTGEDTRYVGVYNAQDWRCYTSINNNIKNSITAFYKRVEKGEEPVELPEGTVYLWDAGKEAGGVAVATDGTSVGYANIVNSSTAAEVTYTTIRLNGNANYSIPEDNSRSNTTITLDQPLKAGDKISITAYRNKSAADKKSGARLKFDKGGELTTGEGLEFVNLDASNGSAADSNRGTEPNTIVVEVPQEADGSTVITLTRSYTSTNLFITKIEVTTEAEQPIVLPEDLAEALALLNQTIEDAIDVLADNVASTEAEDTFLDAIDEADALYRKGMSGKEGVTVDDVNEQITKLLAAIDAYKAAAEAYDPTTGISALSANDSRRQVYTLGGQRVSGQLQKGLYIINGRKVVIK